MGDSQIGRHAQATRARTLRLTTPLLTTDYLVYPKLMTPNSLAVRVRDVALVARAAAARLPIANRDPHRLAHVRLTDDGGAGSKLCET